MTDVQNLVRFFLNGFSPVEMSDTDTEISPEQAASGRFLLADGSWQAQFHRNIDDSWTCAYGDSGGWQGNVRIVELSPGTYVTFGHDWEQCFGVYDLPEGEMFAEHNKVLQIVWRADTAVEGSWTGSTPVDLGDWDGEYEEDTETPEGLAAWRKYVDLSTHEAALPVQDTVPVDILTAGQFDGAKCEYSTGITVHTIQKFVAWSEDARDLQVCTRPECIEKLCAEADKNRSANL